MAPLTDLQKEKIEKLSVRPAPGAYLPGWSVEGQRAEQGISRYREESTISDRIEALRRLR